MHHVVHLIVGEGAVMCWLLSARAVGQLLRRALYEFKRKRSFAKPYILEADFSRPVAPTFPASKRAAHQTGIGAGINALHGYIVPAHRETIVNQKVGGLRIAHLLQAFFC